MLNIPVILCCLSVEVLNIMPKFDQHFLIEKNIVQKIVSSCEFTKEDIVVEIGPGKGILTEEIVPRVRNIFLVEIDKGLTDLLKNKFKDYIDTRKMEIINTDFLEFDLNTINLSTGEKLKIIGNIPYSITTPIIKKIFEFNNWEMTILMMQKEVADRILSKPGYKSFSRLTLWTNFYSKIFPVCKVNKNCFRPVPEVDSYVIKFLPNNEFNNLKIKDELFKIITLAFLQRRKMLLNSLSYGLKISKEEIKKVIINSGINPDTRPEMLGLEQFIKLTEILVKFKSNPQLF